MNMFVLLVVCRQNELGCILFSSLLISYEKLSENCNLLFKLLDLP